MRPVQPVKKASSRGSGVALIRAKAAIKDLKGANEDQTHGIQIALRAMVIFNRVA